MGFLGLKLLKNLKFKQNLLTILKIWEKQNKRKQKRRQKDGKTPPAKKMDDMTNEELHALLIPGNSMLDDEYGMELFPLNY